ncbi:phosphopentomutase-like [Tachypleus tridentatus]|uniref:phosphopentomutase-like n=1 Tax=Tachypleus tridentatus TaxID=6853 RepID=UPI003FCF82A7
MFMVDVAVMLNCPDNISMWYEVKAIERLVTGHPKSTFKCFFRFAELVATVFISQDIPAYLYSDITPTPFVPFGVLQLGCAAGVMVTASHNPKDDNGYKVYWSNGAQIISPHDKGIQKSIEENLEPWPSSWKTEVLSSSPLHKDPLDNMKRKYYDCMSENIYEREMNAKCSLTFTFTAMHGVSHTFMVEAFIVCGFQQFVPVPEQMEPDPDFPTVKFPNPEEGKSALDLSMHTANTNNSSLILANDPDADRLAIAEKLPSGEWKVFTGNETGALLGWWLWYCHKQGSEVKGQQRVCYICQGLSCLLIYLS